MSQNNTIEEYFKMLAIEHSDINHSDNQPHFYRMELEEVLMNLRSKVNFPFVGLERIESKFNNSPGQTSKRKSIALMFISKVENNSNEAVNAIYDLTDEVADEFLRRVYDDVVKLTGPFTNIDWNSLDIQQIAFNDASKIAGCRLIFDTIENFNKRVTTSKWNK